MAALIAHPSVKLFRRLQFAFEPTECGVLLHGIKLVATLAPDPSRCLARRWDKLQPRAAPRTPRIYDLSHAEILADRREASILNAIVLVEYSTLEGVTSLRRIRESAMSLVSNRSYVAPRIRGGFSG
jgi:hypothetical protein